MLGAIAIGGIAGGLWKKGQDQAKKNMANYNALQRENSKFLTQKPFYEKGLKRSEDLYNKGAEGEFSADTLEAVKRMRERAMGGSDLARASQAEMLKTIGGGYLNNNPYLDAQVQKAINPAVSNIKGSFAQLGRYGSPASANAIGRTAGDISSKMYFNNYNQERDRMFRALPVAQQMALADYADIDRLRQAGSYYDQGSTLDRYLSRIGDVTSTPVNQLYNNKYQNLLGLGMQGAGMLLKAKTGGMGNLGG